jgi:hypothetical protein
LRATGRASARLGETQCHASAPHGQNRAQHPRENGPAWRVILPTLPAFDNFKQAILQKLLLEIG